MILSCENLLLFFVLCDYSLNIFWGLDKMRCLMTFTKSLQTRQLNEK